MPIEKKNVLNIRVERSEAGIRISLQSDIDWSAVRGAARNPDFDFLSIPCAPFKSNLKETINRAGKIHKVVINNPSPQLYDGDNINATFLQAKALGGTGVAFLIPATAMTPIGKAQLEDFKSRMAGWATDIYAQLIKSVMVKCIIVTHEYIPR